MITLHFTLSFSLKMCPTQNRSKHKMSECGLLWTLGYIWRLLLLWAAFNYISSAVRRPWDGVSSPLTQWGYSL